MLSCDSISWDCFRRVWRARRAWWWGRMLASFRRPMNRRTVGIREARNKINNRICTCFLAHLFFTGPPDHALDYSKLFGKTTANLKVHTLGDETDWMNQIMGSAVFAILTKKAPMKVDQPWSKGESEIWLIKRHLRNQTCSTTAMTVW